ncbi:uncharacterized protein LOC127788810 [Diospyros lotus]|uniref:uncharacterized protein LOC127788810 n=1 Tax=Diospyros lotus TaxID=55363 RepID=UPI002254483C|nr:uncharacterized protein LOC127788810 [Diospyros lotus]
MDETDFKGLRHSDVYCENEDLISDLSLSTGGLLDKQSTENQNNGINFEFLVAFDAEKAVEKTNISPLMEEPTQPSELLDQENTRKNGTYNLRKSLAWDTAFFTNAGVLEPEELSCMIKGADNGGKHFLPGIAEDIRRSNDSISTLESESLTIESLEADLFEDIRASIQKSSKAYHMTISGKTAPEERENQVVCSSGKVGSASRNAVMVKPNSAAKNQGAGMQGPEKLIKQRAGYSESQGTQPVPRIGGLTSSLRKASKEITRSAPISSAPQKRASLGANQIKMGNDKARSASVYGKVDLVSKLGPSRAVPRPAVSSKSFSPTPSTATKKELSKSSSSYASSGSPSPSNIGASSVKSTRRRFGSQTLDPTSDRLILKTPSKVAQKNKRRSNTLARLASSDLSSNVSPASSSSEWSSESSSSAMPNASRTCFDIGSPCRFLGNDIPPSDCCNQSNDHISDEHNKATLPRSETVKAASGQLGGHSQPATAKPSGLRMPSPKIGFFDGVKPVLRTPKGSVQAYSGIPAGPKFGPGICNLSGGSNKAKHSKLQPVRVLPANGNVKLDSPKHASPVLSQKLSSASSQVPSASGGLTNFVDVSPEVQGEIDGESCLKDVDVGPGRPDEAKNVPHTGLDAEMTRSLGILKSEMNLENQRNTTLKDEKVASIDINASRSQCKADHTKPSEDGDEDASSNSHRRNDLHSLYENNENAHFVDQDDGLVCINAGAGNSKQGLQKAFVGNSITQNDFCHPYSGQEEESESNLSVTTIIYPSPMKSGTTASTRPPFTVKNSLCN